MSIQFNTGNYTNITQQQINGLIDSIFVENVERRLSADTWRSVFGSRLTMQQVYRKQNLAAFGKANKLAEGQDFPNYSNEEGYAKNYTQQHFGNSLPITKDMRKFGTDLYSELQENLVPQLTDALMDYVDQDHADILNGGRSSTYVDPEGDTVDNTTPDGENIFSDNHKYTAKAGATTFSNIIHLNGDVAAGTANPTFSVEALKGAKIQAAKIRNSAGRLTPVRLDTLLVGSLLMPQAIEVVKSTNVANTANNNTNEYLAGMNIIEWARLTDNYRFTMDAAKNRRDLECVISQPPELTGPQESAGNQTRTRLADMYYATAKGIPAHIFGSNGSNS